PEGLWFQEDVGVVGTDGFARTTSPPFQGTAQSGLIAVTVVTGLIVVGSIGLEIGLVYGAFAAISGYFGIGSFISSAGSAFMSLLQGPATIEVRAIPAAGGIPEFSQNFNLVVNPNRVSKYKLD